MVRAGVQRGRRTAEQPDHPAARDYAAAAGLYRDAAAKAKATAPPPPPPPSDGDALARTAILNEGLTNEEEAAS